MKESRNFANTSLCEGVRPLLSPYIDGRVAPAEAELIEAHVAGCDACRAELSQLRSLVQALRALPQVAAPRSFALPAAGARSARAYFLANVLWLRRAAAGLAACLVLLFGLGPYLGSTYQTASPSAAKPAAFAERRAPAAGTQAPAAPSAPPSLQAAGQADASKSIAGGEPTPQPPAAAAQAPVPAAAAPAAETAIPRLAAGAATPIATAPAAGGVGPQAAAELTAAAPPAENAAREEAAGPPAALPPTQGRPALWIAEFALALALLLAVVGAFLGPRSRAG